jgi:DNA invertase Pin-like site-specific DNA recombinase
MSTWTGSTKGFHLSNRKNCSDKPSQLFNGGRPKLEPTKEQRNDVRALASCGTAQDVIARYLRISTHTLRLHFRG